MPIHILYKEREIAQQIGKNACLFVCDSSPLPAQVMDDFKTKYGHAILESYGMTINNPYTGERRARTVGFPLPEISAKIILPNGVLATIAEEGEM